ncbi:MAG: ABC transporter ATP-binding protein [Candidatus Thermoplasmatota archaeon]|jgi:ABC-2 type transport system ATP-binding protein|nr:ABC transporter ATP-binding protein [Candidatus Thermoplasmatota archaeon]MCL5790574.1 ABC transporter ATP-binding protein [Candidatus Thermoplasmatota archaeon]
MSIDMKIEVSELSKIYGKFTAVDHISFNIDGSGATAYLGQNGAGKTTTFKMMTGLIKPSTGYVKIGGYDIIRDRKRILSGIGALVETPEPYPSLTVRESIMLVGELKGMKKKDIEDHIENFGKRVEIPDPSRKVGTLSRGQRARVVFAAAFLNDPSIIFLDEPTNGMDPAERKIIRDVILDWKKDHMIMLSSHLLQEVTDTCENIIFINHGKMTIQDKTREIERRFNSKSVRVQFIDPVTLSDIQRASLPSVEKIEEESTNSFILYFDGNLENKAEILNQCLKIGRVTSYADYESSLEEAFVNLIKEKQ